VFIDDDEGYEEWLQDHEHSWVLNSHLPTPGSSSHVIHHSSCWSIRGEPSHGSRWTHEYLKACGDRDAVVLFARIVIGKSPVQCGHCKGMLDA
jgi:hypothetical protein